MIRRKRCSRCGCYGKSKDGRVPFGWKRDPDGDRPVCSKCWNDAYAVRALTMPVACPLRYDGLPEGDMPTWDMLGAALRVCWSQSTSLANWAVHELARADVARTAGMEKLPPMPAISLYQRFHDYDGRDQWAALTQSASSMLRAIEARYRSKRFAVIWQRKESLPVYRYPYPFPFHNNSYAVSCGDDGPCVTLNLPAFESQGVEYPAGKWILRLRGGENFRRQVGFLRQIVAGKAVQCEAAILRGRSRATMRRGGVESRDKLGDKKQYRVMVKVVVWLPRKSDEDCEPKLMELATDAEALFVARIEGMTESAHAWILNADHIKERWGQLQYAQRRHDVYRQRQSEDLKFEKRWPKARRRSMLAELNARCEKHRRRVNTFIDEAVACVVGYARRQRVATVAYNSSQRGFIAHFPWSQLEEKLRRKLEHERINFVSASGVTADETPGPARNSENDE